ncbi:alanyl-tRNA editing protein [Candidatus Woesearchaeota archaeon]|nr:alanyl-tRNA editing protein [Candidatus Woesearchaeota archaeon]
MKHLEDSYVKEWKTTVKDVKDGKFVTLSETYFYPMGGGQPHDEGIIKKGDEEYKVVFAKKFDEVSHEVDKEGLAPGDEVEVSLDWERRYHLMRLHTAAHVVSALIRNKTNALITGNQLSPEKVRIDFSLEQFDPEMFRSIIDEANTLIEKGAPMKFEVVTHEQALDEPALAGLAKGLPEHEDIRVVEIEEQDRQACGGTHVKDIKEIGKLEFMKAENKGKQNRRVYFKLA